MDTTSQEEAKEKLFAMIKDIRTAQLVTRDREGKMHARPMHAQQEEFDGELWFFTSKHSPKVREILHDEQVLLSYASPEKNDYVSINGRAEIVTERAEIEARWNELLRVWFPEGKESEEIALIRVTVELAEYWDANARALVHLYGYVKARLTGERPEGGENRVVSFRKKPA